MEGLLFRNISWDGKGTEAFLMDYYDQGVWILFLFSLSHRRGSP
jgi:hypothetical protein